MDNPSGILCRASDMASDIPSFVFFVVVIKVIIPSGMLWIMSAIHDMSPILYNDVIFFFDIILSMYIAIIKPIFIKENDKRQQEMFGIICFSSDIDSGISSIIDTDSITPAANDRLFNIILLLFFDCVNMGIVPIRVDSPDNMVIVNDRVILFILFTIKLYDLMVKILAFIWYFSIILFSYFRYRSC